MKVFLDAGAFLALADEDDKYHSVAVPIFTDLIQTKAQVFTSNLILSETYTVIRLKVSHEAAVKFMRSLDGTSIKILRVSEAIEKMAKAIFVRYNDKNFSFVDSTSFALIDHHKLDHAFAFDRHFRQYRFRKNVVVLPTEPD